MSIDKKDLILAKIRELALTMKDPVEQSREINILIADDEPAARDLLSIVLSEPNYNITACVDGDEAITRCKDQLPDLAILDVQMPGSTGLDVCRFIKETQGRVFVPVILLTSLAELQNKLAGLNTGADDYVTKPFQIAELEARVRAMLRIKMLTDQLRETQDLLALKEKELIATQVAGAAAHELGQPLTTLLLNCDLLSKVPANSPAFMESISVLKEQAKKMKEILNRLNSLDGYRTRSYPGDLSIIEIE